VCGVLAVECKRAHEGSAHHGEVKVARRGSMTKVTELVVGCSRGLRGQVRDGSTNGRCVTVHAAQRHREGHLVRVAWET
jgi:hypothetical protein